MKKISLLLFLFLGLLLALAIPAYTAPGGAEDFVKYWASSRLLIGGRNPYDQSNMVETANAARPDQPFKADDLIVPWNPPWLMVILIPFALLPFNISVHLWILASTFLVILSGYLTWSLLGLKQDIRGYVFVLIAAFLFGNTLYLFRIGQITSLVMACLLLSVIWLDRKKYELVGLMILLMTVKFQITYLVLLIFFFWMLRHRQWRIALGTTIGMAVSFIVCWILFPGWLGAYLNRMTVLTPTLVYSSTLGSFAYWVFGLEWVKWLTLLVLPIALPLSGKTEQLGWLTVVNLALVISVPLSLFGDSFDHVIYLLPLTQLIGWLRHFKFNIPWAKWAVFGGMVLSYVVIYGMMSIPILPYYWLVLPALMISIVFLFAFYVLWKGNPQFQTAPAGFS